MSQVVFSPEFSGGRLKMPPSKSMAHRILLCAALSKGRCVLSNIDFSDDIEATAQAIMALGASAQYFSQEGRLEMDAAGIGRWGGEIDCRESGSTLRFLIPIAAALGGRWTFTGRGRLPQRPLGIYQELLPEYGVTFYSQGGLPLTIEGKLTPGEYKLPGNVSSQFITGLLFSLPLLKGESKIVLTTPLESKGYVDMTISALSDFGINIVDTERGWIIPGGQSYKPGDFHVEGDWSQAAFFLAMAALDPRGNKVRLEGLSKASLQGDMACIELFRGFGLDICWEGDVLAAWNTNASEAFGGLRGQIIDAAQIPDMVPALSVCAALCSGETVIKNASRLRLKESDRLAAMEEAINALGGNVSSTEDGLIIKGVKSLGGGLAQGKNDHRIVMALSAAALRCDKPVTVTDARSINKSYPAFYQDYIKLGGKAHVVDVG